MGCLLMRMVICILGLLTVLSNVNGKPTPEFSYGGYTVQEGYGYLDSYSAAPVPGWTSIDPLIAQFGPIPVFKPMPISDDSYSNNFGGYDSGPSSASDVGGYADAVTTSAPAPAPVIVSTKSEAEPPKLTPKAKIIEGALTFVDGVVETVVGHFGPKVTRVVGHFQPKVARLAGHFQPKVARVVGRVRPKFVQVATHYAPAIAKTRERLGPVVARVSKGVTTFLTPDSPAAAVSAAASSTSSVEVPAPAEDLMAPARNARNTDSDTTSPAEGTMAEKAKS